MFLKSQSDGGAAQASIAKQGQQAGHKMMDSAQQPRGTQPTAASQAQQQMMQHMRPPGQQ